MSYFDTLPRELLIKIIETGQGKYYFDYVKGSYDESYIVVYFNDIQIFSFFIEKISTENQYQSLMDAIDNEPTVKEQWSYFTFNENWGCCAGTKRFPEMEENNIYILQIEGNKYFAWSPFLHKKHLDPYEGEHIEGFCVSLDDCIVDSLRQTLTDFINDKFK